MTGVLVLVDIRVLVRRQEVQVEVCRQVVIEAEVVVCMQAEQVVEACKLAGVEVLEQVAAGGNMLEQVVCRLAGVLEPELEREQLSQ